MNTAEELAFSKDLLCARHLSHRISISLHNLHKRQLSLSHFKDEATEVEQVSNFLKATQLVSVSCRSVQTLKCMLLLPCQPTSGKGD